MQNNIELGSLISYRLSDSYTLGIVVSCHSKKYIFDNHQDYYLITWFIPARTGFPAIFTTVLQSNKFINEFCEILSK